MLSTEIEYLGGCIVEQPEASVNINNNPINLTLSPPVSGYLSAQ